MGINIPTREELIANKLDPPELAEAVGKSIALKGFTTAKWWLIFTFSNSNSSQSVGADSLVYLSVGGLNSAVTYSIREKDPKKIGHCVACLTGQYPEKLEW